MSYKCKGYDKKGACPLRDDCYRYLRKPDKQQKYYDRLPYSDTGGRCDFYLPTWVLEEFKMNTNGTTNNRSNGKEGWHSNE